ncbi:transposable element Tcb2 transposase [Trichonephila clavipes]|nr:transposable element Tcb2 transposase [Trichonephila clavipes]
MPDSPADFDDSQIINFCLSHQQHVAYKRHSIHHIYIVNWNLNSINVYYVSQADDRCHLNDVRKGRAEVDISLRCFRRQYEQQLSRFERGRIIGMMKAGWNLAEGHLGTRRTLRVLPLTPTHLRLRLEWCHARGNWTVAERNQVVFSDEYRFNISSEFNRVRVWSPRGERLNHAFALHLHTAPTAAQRYVLDIFKPYVLPIMQRLPGVIFKQDNACPHMARVSQDCIRNGTILYWPSQSPDLSPFKHIRDHLGP